MIPLKGFPWLLAPKGEKQMDTLEREEKLAALYGKYPRFKDIIEKGSALGRWLYLLTEAYKDDISPRVFGDVREGGGQDAVTVRDVSLSKPLLP